jgi:hypothetical protein
MNVFAMARSLPRPRLTAATFALAEEKPVMKNPSVITTQYLLRRLTIDVDVPVHEFRAHYEAAVPRYPEGEVKALVAKGAPWQEMLNLVTRVAPLGFLLYGTIEMDPVMRLAGDGGSCVAYLMGNHTIAERMFRHDPSVMLHAPLRTAIWSHSDGSARFTLDKPSDHFGSFANAAIADVGVELDRKVAALLEHLGVGVPDDLLNS